MSYENIIDETFPGASDDIWRNDSSGFLGSETDGWYSYLKDKSDRYRREDYLSYYEDIYEPYLKLSKQYPEIVDEIKITCQKWCDGEIDDSKRLYKYLLKIISRFQLDLKRKKIENNQSFSISDDE